MPVPASGGGGGSDVFKRFTDDARQVVVVAQEEARRLRHCYIGTEHILLGLVQGTTSLAAQVLAASGLTAQDVRDDIGRLLAPVLGTADADALAIIGIDLDAVRERVESAFGVGALERGHRCCVRRRGGTALGEGSIVPLTPRAKKVLELALRESLRLRSRYIGTEHILLGLIREGQGLAVVILGRRGIEPEDLRRQVCRALGAAA